MGSSPSYIGYFRPKWATLRALFACLNRKTSTSVPRETEQKSRTRRRRFTLTPGSPPASDLEVGVYANVASSTSLSVLDVVAHANVRTTTSLAIGQTTHTALRVGFSVGRASAPVASKVLSTSSLWSPPMADAASRDPSLVINCSHHVAFASF